MIFIIQMKKTLLQLNSLQLFLSRPLFYKMYNLICVKTDIGLSMYITILVFVCTVINIMYGN